MRALVFQRWQFTRGAFGMGYRNCVPFGVATLSVELGENPPSEFRLFRRGENRTTKGVFIFDDQAASSVMLAFRELGNDGMIDLEHLSLDPSAAHYDPDSRGAYQLYLRDGELWTKDVRWTADGAERLTQRRQRYASPVFEYDSDRRVRQIINVALTSLPATYSAQALVAASRRAKLGMDLEQLKSIAVALGLSEGATVEEILAAIGGLVKSCQDACSGKGEPAKPAASEPAEPAPEMAAMSARLMALTGRPALAAALSDVEQWRESHVALLAERAEIAKQRAALEGAERKKLVGDLVKLGAELPATAWADTAALQPVKRLADEPLDELRNRVAILSQARGGQAAPQPPTGQASDLTESERRACELTGCKPEDLRRRKAAAGLK